MARLYNKIGGDKDSSNMISGLQDLLYSTHQNQISDSLAKTARFFHREIYFISCSILV